MEFAKLPTFTEENVKLRSRAELEGFLMLMQRNVRELARENADLLAQIAELTQPPKEVEQPSKEVKSSRTESQEPCDDINPSRPK